MFVGHYVGLTKINKIIYRSPLIELYFSATDKIPFPGNVNFKTGPYGFLINNEYLCMKFDSAPVFAPINK